MGNQQERLAAYLAGVIDGEGWVGVAVNKNRGGFSLKPTICVHIVEPDWADHLNCVARELGLPSHLGHFKSSSRWGIYGIKRVMRAYPVLSPHLVNKSKQLALLMNLCYARQQRHYLSSEPSEFEWRLVKDIKSLNTKGKNPQRLYAERREAKI